MEKMERTYIVKEGNTFQTVRKTVCLHRKRNSESKH